MGNSGAEGSSQEASNLTTDPEMSNTTELTPGNQLVGRMKVPERIGRRAKFTRGWSGVRLDPPPELAGWIICRIAKTTRKHWESRLK